jgi:hypothetical protein
LVDRSDRTENEDKLVRDILDLQAEQARLTSIKPEQVSFRDYRDPYLINGRGVKVTRPERPAPTAITAWPVQSVLINMIARKHPLVDAQPRASERSDAVDPRG